MDLAVLGAVAATVDLAHKTSKILEKTYQLLRYIHNASQEIRQFAERLEDANRYMIVASSWKATMGLHLPLLWA